jgi:Rrf2 family nitric oxide-sensitive transcriptional repressor
MELVRRGYLEAIRGKGDGIRLGKPVENIVLIDIVTHFESTLTPITATNNPAGLSKTAS